MSAAHVGTSYSLVTEDRAAVLAALTRGQCDGLLPAACGFMDEFAAFIAEVGLLKLFDRFPDHRSRRSIAAAFFCNTLLHKALLRLDSLAQIGPVLFHSPDVLRKLGFNFRQINEGFYTGASQRPFDAEALADYFADIPVEELLKHQLKVARQLLKACPELHEEGVAVLDANTVTVPPGHRKRPGMQYKTCVLGLRYDGRLYPLLWHFTQRGVGEDGDLTQGKRLISEALKAWPKGTIRRILIDRGFIDGKWLSELKALGIDTVIGLREDMDLHADMLGLSRLDDAVWPPAPPPKLHGTPLPQRSLCHLTDLNTWSACTVDLQGIVIRDVYSDRTEYQCIVTTDLTMNADAIHQNCRDRWSIEESFMDLTRYWNLNRFGSCRPRVVAAQVHFTLLAYTLLHLCIRRIADAAAHAMPSAALLSGREIVAYWRDRYAILLLSELVAIIMEHYDAWAANKEMTLAALRACEGPPPPIPPE